MGETKARINRVGGFLSGLFSTPSATRDLEALASPDAHPAVNDAEAYGVRIEPASLEPGTWYWQVVRVHHLTPEENGGKHHIYMDVLDVPSGSQSYQRVAGAVLKVSWEGGEQTVVVDKPIDEPGTNFPLWKWQVCTVEALGLPGHNLPSDRVTGIHTGHPDEETGNTLFHHSFAVTFYRSQAPITSAESVIAGTIHNGAGRTVRLVQGGEVVASQAIAGDDTFRFTGLAAGQYVVEVVGSTLRSTPQVVDGRNQVALELTLVVVDALISGRVRQGAGRTLLLLREGVEVARQQVAADERYHFADLPSGSYRLVIEGTWVASAVLALDGKSPVTVDLVAPLASKILVHYVLVAPAERAATQVALLLAQDYLLAFGPAFGFSAQEAAQAGLVTILANASEVPLPIEAELAAAGVVVQRITGNADEIAQALGARVASGWPFVPA